MTVTDRGEKKEKGPEERMETRGRLSSPDTLTSHPQSRDLRWWPPEAAPCITAGVTSSLSVSVKATSAVIKPTEKIVGILTIPSANQEIVLIHSLLVLYLLTKQNKQH